MDITIDEEQLLTSVIEKVVRENGSDSYNITDIVKKEIENHRNGLTAAEDILSKDCQDILDNVRQITNINIVTVDDIFLAILIFWQFFCLIFRTGQHFGVVIYKCFGCQNSGVSISSIDQAYIDDNYVSCCSEFWFEEVEIFLKENHEARISDANINHEGLEHLLDSIKLIKDLSQIPEPQRELKYYKLLIKNRHLIGRGREENLIRKYKNICLELIITHSNAFRVEAYFLETFVTFYRSFKNTRYLIDKLQLDKFCSGDLTLGQFLEKIENFSSEDRAADLADFQDAANCLKRESNPFLSRTSRDVIKAYVKPVEIVEKNLDGRSVIEVAGRIIVVSDILQQLETVILNNSGIAEVRFVGCDVIHIDEDLKNDTWHGKNIVILATTIKIDDKVTWDVSGKDSDHIYSSDAGTDQDGYGKQGADGFAGESGGNVLIEATEVTQPEKFVITSNGGNGSRGQDGGNGRNGDDGRGISVDEFDRKFPSVVKLFDLSAEGRRFETSIEIIALTAVRNVYWQEYENKYIEATTAQKNQITFSCAGGIATSSQAFLLYKGSSGRPGKPGGECGLGGQGGHYGEISCQSIIAFGNPGKEGEHGNGGLYGSPGKNGWDMGYMDYQTWSETLFCGKDENSTIQLKYHDSNWFSAPSSAVWCPYRGEYVEFTRFLIEHKKRKEYQQRMETRSSCSKPGDHSQAVKKKSISRGKILTEYSDCYNSLDRTMTASSQSKLGDIIQRAVQAMIENTQQQEKVTTEMKVNHLVTSVLRDKKIRRNRKTNTATSNATSKDTANSQPSDIKRLIHELTTNDGVDRNSTLRNKEMPSSYLRVIFSKFYAPNVEYSENQDKVKQLLIEKYRLAVLREISRNELLPGNDYDFTDSGIQVTAKRASRYLVLAEEYVDEISHDILGTLNQYLYRNGNNEREKIRTFCEDISQGTDNEPLRRSVRTFVLEAVKSNRVNHNIAKYYDEYREFLKKQLHDLNLLLEPLNRELELEQYKEIRTLWVQRNNHESIRFELNRKIQEHKVLNILYRCFNRQLKHTYDWSKCWVDEDFIREYYKDIRQRGPLSKSCRELLAHVFQVNIRVYFQDQSNKLRLVDDHNPSAEQAVYILNGESQLELKQLKIDENFLKLEKQRAKMNNIYAQILARTNKFREKHEFDDYFESGTFLSDHVFDNNAQHQSLSDENENFLTEDQAIIEIIKYFSCPDERLQMKERLEKISSKYLGNHRILHYISKRFANDGRHVFYQELCYLVNSILSSAIDDNNDLNIFCWIVAAYPQNNWTDELVLLQVENYFKKLIPDKLKWRNYLSNVTDKNILMLFKSRLNQNKFKSTISINFIEEILRLLSSIPNEMVNLEGIELSIWPCTMKEIYWTHKLSPLAKRHESEKLSGASYYLLSMENIFGTSLVTDFIDTLINKDPSPETLTDILTNFCNGNWNLSKSEVEALSDDCISVGAWSEQMRNKFSVDRTDRDITRLVELMEGNDNSSKSILTRLPEIKNIIRIMPEQNHDTNWEISRSISRLVEWVKVTNNYENGTFDNAPGIGDVVRTICHHELQTGYDIGNTDPRILYYGIIFRKHVKNYLDTIDESDKKEFLDESRADMLAVIDKVVELEKGFKLRDAQKLAILVLLMNENNTLAQVSTGEGKTLIVAVASIMKALLGETVHVITSSPVLAKDNAEENVDIFGRFGIRVSSNCSEDVDQRKAAYSSSDVVYGDLSSFQRDYLLDKFYGKNILGDCRLANVIADEVDSMLLDRGNNMLYLSHDLAGLDKLESVYLYIWQCVNRPASSPEDYSSIFDVESIRKSVLDDVYGLLDKKDIRKIDPKFDEQQVKLIWEGLIDIGMLDEEGKMLREKIDDNELKDVLSPDLSSHVNRLSFLLKERIERVKHIRVPNYLKPFVEDHLETWINSAVTAVTVQAGNDYTIDSDMTGTGVDRNPHITIVDRDTGTDQTNSQWDEALHQFIQFKHGCRLSMQSLKAVFISNVSYLKRYSKLYGLTGTLGSQRERELLKEVHGVDFVTIPTSKSRQFIEKPPIICANKYEWTEQIINESKKVTETSKRSVLIICETIEAAETLYKNFGKIGTRERIHIYTRDHEQFDIARGDTRLQQGLIIISTNLSGRGTDMKITEELERAGGLHVIETYLPGNSRILEQAFGRAGRKGEKGSGRLIIVADSTEEGCGNVNIFHLKNERDIEESYRISVLKSYYETQITTEENCFQRFQELFVQLKSALTASTEIKNILLIACLDKWAFWLDKNSKSIKNLADEESKQNLEISLNEFLSQLRKCDSSNWVPWVEGQPVQMIKIGKCLCLDGKYDEAIKLFDEVIESEPNFSEAAHYYKAFALMKKVHLVDPPLRKQALKEVKTELREAARLFEEHSEFSTYAGGVIRAVKKYIEQLNIIQVDTYAEQQKNLSQLYYIFSQSIDDIFDKHVTPESFFGADINEQLSEVVYEELVRNGILRKPKIKMNITEGAWDKINLDYGTPVSELKNYLSPIRGREIDEKELLTMLKNNVRLPSRENFWKLLIERGILHAELKCVIIHVQELEKLDSSLLGLIRDKIANNELHQPTLEPNNANEMILHTEQIVPEDDRFIVEKSTLQTVMTAYKREYKYLKEKGVFSVNKKALVDPSKISSANFSRYDSITLNDLTAGNIPRDDAEKILAELVEQNVLENVIPSNGVYRLGIPSEEIHLIRLSSCPVYQNAVQTLLSQCFIYRIALDGILKQLQHGILPVQPRLTSHPHNKLIYQLLDQKIIKPVKFSSGLDDLDTRLRQMFERRISLRDLQLLISHNGLILEEANAVELCNHLVEKKWLHKSKSRCTDEDNVLDQCLEEVAALLGTKYTINDSTKREALTLFTEMEIRIKQIFDNRIKLANQSTIEHISEVLKKSISPLHTLKIPNSSLKALTEYNGLSESRYTDEVTIFTLNSLDQVLLLEEKKWSRKMMVNTAIVIAMGISQVTMGAAIEVLSAGVFTQGAGILIGEGIGDVIFAIGAYRSGHFGWNSYRQHKLQSLPLSFATAGFAGLLAGGAGAGGVELLAATSRQVIQNIGLKGVATSVGKIVVSKIVSAATIGLSYTGIDVLVQNFRKTICNGMSTVFLSNIRSRIAEHDIGTSLENVYRLLGRDRAMQIINDLTESSLNEKSLIATYLPIVSRSAHAVSQEMKEALKKITRGGKGVWNLLRKILNGVIAALPWVAEKIAYVCDIRNSTGNLLNNMENKLRHALRTHAPENPARQNAPDQNPQRVQDCEKFKKEVIEKWDSMIRDRAGQIMEQHLVNPVLNVCVGSIVTRCEKIIENQIRSYDVGQSDESLEDQRRVYHESQRNHNILTSDAVNEVAECQVAEYHEQLKELEDKRSNCEIFSAVRENVPLDVTCLDACTQAVRKVSGIEGLTIIAKGENVTNQEMHHVVELELVDNRFQLYGSGVSRSNGNGELEKNYLYEAVSQHVNLNMSRQSFAIEVANWMQRNKDRCHIEQRCYSLFTRRYEFSDQRVIKMSNTNALWRNTDFDLRVTVPLQSTSAERGCRRIRKPIQLVRGLVGNVENNRHIEPFSEVATSDGFVFLHNSRSVAAAITRSPTERVQVMAYEEIGESRFEYNSWRRSTKEAIAHRMAQGGLNDLRVDINGQQHDVAMQVTESHCNARMMVTEQQHVSRNKLNWRQRFKKQ